jgi:uncharacterized protein YjbJ (UPF0337 family)
MWNKDERDGKVDQAKGRVKEAVGDLTGNKHLHTEGKADVAKGKVQAAVGDMHHKVGDAIKDLGAAVKK